MIFDLRFLSGESDDFIMDMQIDGRSTFAQLHNAIQQQLNYDASQMASFFTTDKDWNKETEIMLFDMAGDDQSPVITMDNAVIEDYIQDMHQRFLYVYDFFSERCFFVEIMKAHQGELMQPSCLQCVGEVPQQISIDDSFEDDDQSFDEDDQFELEDLDDIDPDTYNSAEFDEDYY
jgi:hypothetical protein